MNKKENIVNEVKEIIKKYNQKLTLRQIFYRLVAKGIIQNEHNQYKSLSTILKDARKKGHIPFDSMEDRTREIINKSRTSYYSWKYEVNQLLEWIKNPYYYLPDNLYQNKITLILLEKQALEGIFRNAINNNSILVVSKGYNSLTQIYELSELLINENREFHCYFFSDYDPSGVDIQRNFKEQAEELGILFKSFKRIALTEDLITKYSLPYAPPKKKDSRSKNWKGEGVVELDALEPNILESLIKGCCSENWDKETEKRKERLEKILNRRYCRKLSKELQNIIIKLNNK